MRIFENKKSIDNALFANSFFSFTQVRFFAGYYFGDKNKRNVRA